MSSKLYIQLIFLFIFSHFCYSQPTEITSSILSEEETQKLFTDSIKKQLGIDFLIFRAYSYVDKSGKYFLLLTERKYKEENNKPLIDSIKAFNIKEENNLLTINWVIRDFKNRDNGEGNKESSIWFWTKYCELRDIDEDGLIDPVLIYGTFGTNGFDDGRVKILIFYKGKKTAIRHQNGTLDFERHTQVDKTFYGLPEQIQMYFKNTMKKIEANNNAIFPAGYEVKMNAKALYFDENH